MKLLFKHILYMVNQPAAILYPAGTHTHTHTRTTALSGTLWGAEGIVGRRIGWNGAVTLRDKRRSFCSY